ncbi:MAG: GNAT family N-acetyltransferase [Candidatus Roizmanbacteria bacterium]
MDTPTDPTIVPAEEEHLDGILQLVNGDSKHLVPRTREEVVKDIHEWRVITDHKKVIACGCFDYFSDRIAEIRSVIVHPDYRKRGYAEILIRELQKLAKPGQQVFVVTSSPDFFKKFEFSECLGEKYILFYKQVIKS